MNAFGDFLYSLRKEKGMTQAELLSCIIAYLFASVFTGLWHPLWLIIIGGAIVCFTVGAIGDIFVNKK